MTLPDPEVAALAYCVSILFDDIRQTRAKNADDTCREDTQIDRTGDDDTMQAQADDQRIDNEAQRAGGAK